MKLNDLSRWFFTQNVTFALEFGLKMYSHFILMTHHWFLNHSPNIPNRNLRRLFPRIWS